MHQLLRRSPRTPGRSQVVRRCRRIEAVHPLARNGCGSDFGPFELWVQGLLDLPRQEGNEEEEQRADRKHLCDSQQTPSQTLRDMGFEGDGHQQDEPQELGCAVLMVRKAEGDKGQECGGPAPDPEDRQGEDQQQEQIQQRPRGEPVTLDPIGSEEGEEPPAGWQVQLHADRFRIGAPAGRRQGSRVGQPTDGLHFDSPGAEFDTDGPVLGIAGDELTFATAAYRSQLLALGRIETPDLLHLTRNTVLEGQALPAFVEPHLPDDAQARGFLGSHAAHAFHQFERGGNIPAVHRESLPGFGKIAL